MKREMSNMTAKVFALLIFSLLNMLAHAQTASRAGQASTQSAPSLIKTALERMGGEEKLRAIHTVRLEGNGYRNALEQSERPEGPYIVESQKITELRDLQAQRLRRTTTNQTATYEYVETSILADGVAASGFNGGRLAPGQPGLEESLLFAPERLLITALEASDLRVEAETVIQNVP